MAKKAVKDDYRSRKDIRMEDEIDCGMISIGALLEICNHSPTARIEIETWYDDTTVKLVWTVPETDEQMQDRIAKYEAALAKEKNREDERKARQLEQEKKTYLRLKKKFEKKSKETL